MVRRTKLASVMGAAWIAALCCALSPAQAQAQTQAQAQDTGQVRIQGQPFDPNAPAQTATDPFAPGVVINFRENMRKLVQDISAYGRGFNPNFVVLAEHGLGLVNKPNPEDDTQMFPARTYIRSLDGILEPNLLKTLSGTAPPPAPDGEGAAPNTKEAPAVVAARKLLQDNANTASTLGLSIFNLEFATQPQDVDRILKKSASMGFVPFVAQTPFLGELPAYPKYAFNANPQSLNDTTQARNFAYIAHSQGFGTAQDFVQAMSMTNHDMIITSVFHGRTPLSKLDVERLKYKKLGSRRLVLAELDVSSAATYHYYWQAGWDQGSPGFINVPVVEDPDRYRTIYWDPAWQAVLMGSPTSYLYGILDLGFDGVVLKGVDAWRYFESGGDAQ